VITDGERPEAQENAFTKIFMRGEGVKLEGVGSLKQ